MGGWIGLSGVLDVVVVLGVDLMVLVDVGFDSDEMLVCTADEGFRGRGGGCFLLA